MRVERSPVTPWREELKRGEGDSAEEASGAGRNAPRDQEGRPPRKERRQAGIDKEKGVLRLTPRKGKGKGQGPQGRSSNQGDQEKGGGSRRRSPTPRRRSKSKSPSKPSD